MEEMWVEKLGQSSRNDVFTQAFAEYPLIPAIGIRTKNIKGVMNAFLDFFGSTKNVQRYGIRKDRRLVCTSLSVDSSEDPPTLALIRFIFALSRAIGWRAVRELKMVHKEEPRHEGRYLELVLLGTLPAHQRQGFGRKMLQFLLETAKSQGFKGIVLVADPGAPAFQFHLNEGFRVDKEFMAGGTVLCWMRYEEKQ